MTSDKEFKKLMEKYHRKDFSLKLNAVVCADLLTFGFSAVKIEPNEKGELQIISSAYQENQKRGE